MLDWSMRFYFAANTISQTLTCCMIDVDVYISETGPKAIVQLLDMDGREITLPAPLTNAGSNQIKGRVKQKLSITGHAKYWHLVEAKMDNVFDTGSPADLWE